MTRAYFKSFSLLTLILVVELAFGQPTFHVTNYSKSEYQAGNQNWDLSIAGDRLLFVANNNGLLHFNGAKWELENIPSKTIIRSVLYDNDKLFVGSFEEFGYWDINNSKLGNYHSLSSNIKNSPANQEFWRIIKHNNNIYFQSFGSIYVFNGDSIKSIELDRKSVV